MMEPKYYFFFPVEGVYHQRYWEFWRYLKKNNFFGEEKFPAEVTFLNRGNQNKERLWCQLNDGESATCFRYD